MFVNLATLIPCLTLVHLVLCLSLHDPRYIHGTQLHTGVLICSCPEHIGGVNTYTKVLSCR